MPDSLLRRALLGNAVFSASCGAVLILLTAPLADILEVPAMLLFALGAGLLPFAAAVAWVAGNRAPTAVRAVIAADLAWVIAAIAVVTVFGGSMAATTVVALSLVTLAVADFAALQWWGMRRATRVA
jgi:hypothetical protein